MSQEEEQHLGVFWHEVFVSMCMPPMSLDYDIRGGSLHALRLGLGLQRHELEKWGEAHALAEQALESCHGIDSLIRDAYPLRVGAGRDSGPVDVQALLDAMLRVTRFELERTARVEKDYQPIAGVSGAEALLSRVFFTLILDALVAMRAGPPQEHVLRVQTRQHEGKVLVSLSTTGASIPSEVLPRLFEPRCRSPFPGTGPWLGLCHGQAFVRTMGGELRVESPPGGGVHFSLSLSVREQGRGENEEVTYLNPWRELSARVRGEEQLLHALQEELRDFQRAQMACLALDILSRLRHLRSQLKRLRGHVNDAGMGRAPYRLSKYLSSYFRAVSRLLVFFQGLRHLRYRPPEEPLPLEVHASLTAALRITRDELARTVRLEQDLTPRLPRALGHPGHLQGVFLHLIRTALEAMRRGPSRPHVLRVRTGLEQGRLRVSLTDTSHGIPAEKLPFVLDSGELPTSSMSSFCAYGLPISHALLQAMGGELRVESQVDSGTTYSVLLPAHPDDVRHLSP